MTPAQAKERRNEASDTNCCSNQHGMAVSLMQELVWCFGDDFVVLAAQCIDLPCPYQCSDSDATHLPKRAGYRHDAVGDTSALFG